MNFPSLPGVALSPEVMQWYRDLWQSNIASEGQRFDTETGLQREQLADNRAYRQGSLGLQRAQLAESRADRQARLRVSMAQLEADRERIAIERGRAEADAEYKRGVLALQKQELGASLLKTATDLFGKPGSWAQAFNYGRGVAGTQALAEPLRALMGGFDMPAFQLQTGTAAPLTIGGLADRLLGGTGGAGTGGGADPNAEYQANVAAGREIGLNPQKVAPGALESLDANERAFLGGALQANTIDPDSWFSAYARSRPGQGLSSSGLA